MEKWRVLESDILVQNPWVTLRKDHCVNQNGVDIPAYYWIEGNDYVVIVGTTTEGKFVLIEQYRHGIKEVIYEFPAGLTEEGEELVDAAKRELKEETGFIAEDIIFEKALYTASAISNKRGHIFFARNMIDTGVQQLSRSECIKVIQLDFDQLEKWIEDGTLKGGFAVATALLALKKREWFLEKL